MLSVSMHWWVILLRLHSTQWTQHSPQIGTFWYKYAMGTAVKLYVQSSWKYMLPNSFLYFGEIGYQKRLCITLLQYKIMEVIDFAKIPAYSFLVVCQSVTPCWNHSVHIIITSVMPYHFRLYLDVFVLLSLVFMVLRVPFVMAISVAV